MGRAILSHVLVFCEMIYTSGGLHDNANTTTFWKSYSTESGTLNYNYSEYFDQFHYLTTDGVGVRDTENFTYESLLAQQTTSAILYFSPRSIPRVVMRGSIRAVAALTGSVCLIGATPIRTHHPDVVSGRPPMVVLPWHAG
jgi:hypothetical protein